MTIVMKEIKGGTAPVILCDFCGKEIDDVKKGSVLWDGGSEDKYKEIYFAHQGRCDYGIEKKYLHVYSGDELSLNLNYLLFNVKYSEKDAEDIIEMRTGLGLMHPGEVCK